MIRHENSWCQKLPPNWPWRRITDHFALINGFPFPSEGFNTDGVGLPVVRIRDLLSGDLPTYFEGSVGRDTIIKNHDIVIGMDGDFNCVWWKKGDALLNQRVCALRRRRGSRIYPRFAFYQLHAPLKIINDLTPLSTVKHLSSTDVLALRLPTPDLETQKAVAAFLDRETARIDQLIEKRHTFLALLEEKERSIAAQAVNGALVATERDGERGWFGTIPSGWGLLRGKFLFSERQDKSETGDEELLSVSHLTGVTKRSEKDVNMFLAESMEGYKLVSPSDVVVNTMWAWMGAMGVSASEGLISPSYGVYAQTASSYDSAYLDLLLRSKPFVAEVNRRSKGVWSSRLRLYPDAFLDIRFPVPPKVDQERILAVLERELGKERKLASLSRTSIDRLREYRSALITAAVTGQIDVTSWDKRGETDRRLEKIEREMAS